MGRLSQVTGRGCRGPQRPGRLCYRWPAHRGIRFFFCSGLQEGCVTHVTLGHPSQAVHSHTTPTVQRSHMPTHSRTYAHTFTHAHIQTQNLLYKAVTRKTTHTPIYSKLMAPLPRVACRSPGAGPGAASPSGSSWRPLADPQAHPCPLPWAGETLHCSAPSLFSEQSPHLNKSQSL